MSDSFDPHISCDGYSRATGQPGFISKELNITGYSHPVVTPMKAMEMGGLSKATQHMYSEDDGLTIIESPVYVWQGRTWESIRDLIESDLNNTSKFKQILHLKPSLYKDSSDVIGFPSVVFHRNPFSERKTSFRDEDNELVVRRYPPLDRDNFETFLQNLYAFSTGMVLVPDIRISRVQIETEAETEKFDTISVDEYVRTISDFAKVLSDMNKKPIFVPIQVDLTKKSMTSVIDAYKSAGYSNIWVNFNAGEVYGRKLAGLRTVVSILNSQFGTGNYQLYFSHMKKEVSPHLNVSKAPPSDMLSQFVGADFIGGNREPSARRVQDEESVDKRVKDLGLESRQELEQLFREHKSRIFDSDSYYYYVPNTHPNIAGTGYDTVQLVENVRLNKAVDSRVKRAEVSHLRDMCTSGANINTYLKEKSMFRENADILTEITSTASSRDRLFSG